MSGKHPSKQALPHRPSREYPRSSQRLPANGISDGHASSSGTAPNSSHSRDAASEKKILALERSVHDERGKYGRSARENTSVGSQCPQNGRASDSRSPRSEIASSGQPTRKETNVGSSKMPGGSISTPKQGEWDGRSPDSPPSFKHSTQYTRDTDRAGKTRLDSESEILVGGASPQKSKAEDQVAKKELRSPVELKSQDNALKEFSPTPSPQFSLSGTRNDVRTNFLLKMNDEGSLIYPAVEVIEIMKQFGVSQVQPLERFLKNIRINTSYMKTETGESKTKVLKIKGFGRMREPEIDEKGLQKVEDQRLKWKGEADANPGNAIKLRFLQGPGEMISVRDYFAEKGFELKHPKSWVLQCGSKNKDNWIPAELATVIDGQNFHGQLNEEQAEGIKSASRLSAEAAKKLVDKDGRLGAVGVLAESKPNVGTFGAQIVPRTEEVPGIIICGRQLQIPAIKYENTSAQPENAPWNLKDKTMYKTAPSSLAWAMLDLSGAKIPEGREKTILKALESYGLKMQDAFRRTNLCSVKPQNGVFDKDLKRFFEESAKENIKMVLVVLPKKDDSYYAKVKFCGDFMCGIQTICIQSSQLMLFGKETAPFYADIAQKYNLKAGGVNHLLDNSNLLKDPLDGTVFYVGIDVAHSRTDGNNHKAAAYSVAGVVANVDGDFGQWPGSVRYQPGKKETVKDLEVMIMERLRLFVDRQGIPTKIVVYRGSISDRNYQSVLDEEFPMIRNACDKVCRNKYNRNRPMITIIIAGKGHQKRFYPMDRATAELKHQHISRLGTLVDSCKESNRGWEFFLQTYFATKSKKENAPPATGGAMPAKPAHYLVIKDEANHEAKTVEDMTNLLCYLSGRSTAPMSICLPVYYANLLCRRGRHLREGSLTWNPNADEKSGKEAKRTWEGGVHKKLAESMFYI